MLKIGSSLSIVPFFARIPQCRRTMPRKNAKEKKATAASTTAREEDELRKTLKRKRGETISFKEVCFGIGNGPAANGFWVFRVFARLLKTLVQH